MYRQVMYFILVFAFLAPPIFGQFEEKQEQYGLSNPSSLLVSLRPGVLMPIGESRNFFTVGATGMLKAEYGITNRPEWFVALGLNYGYIPIKAEESLSLVDLTLGTGLKFELSPRLDLTGSVHSGVYFSSINGGDEESRPCLSLTGLLGMDFLIGPRFTVNIGAGYMKAFDLYNGIIASLGGSYYFRGRERQGDRLQRSLPMKPDLLRSGRKPGADEGLRVDSFVLDPVFPVFCKYYADNPLGTISVTNQDRRAVSDVVVSLMIPEYMDSPGEYAVSSRIGPGETLDIELNALFADRILGVTEGTKATCDVSLSYKMEGTAYHQILRETVRIHNRNAMTWDDDRKAAAFITARDPAVLSFAKGVSAMIYDSGMGAVDSNLRKAIAIHEALDDYGIRYQVVPETPFSRLFNDADSVDFLQFPRQTLNYSSGDCDDLTVLYCSLLEALSIETAMITVPGHIFMAFALDADESQARRNLYDQSGVIFLEGKVWIPVEITDRSGGFISAWERGASQWREYAALNRSSLIPVSDSWEVYEPVGLPGDEVILTPQERERVVNSYLGEIQTFIDREIYPQVVRIENEINKTGGSPLQFNKLGILYAKYGRLDKAEREFRRNYENSNYLPSLINLGNVSMLRDNWPEALELFEAAEKRAPDKPVVLINLARIHHELENFGLSSRLYNRAREMEPQMAKRYAYLDRTTGAAVTRAADAIAGKERIEWDGE